MNRFNEIAPSQEPNSSFTYSVYSPETREFIHRWHTKRGKIIDCETCYDITERNEPLGKHYVKNTYVTNLRMTHDERAKLRAIIDNDTNTFIMKHDNATEGNMDFLAAAAIDELPSTIRILFVISEKVYIQTSFYVKINNYNFVFESTELAIENHFDIDDSIDMLFILLLEKVKTFMKSLGYLNTDNFRINRLNVYLRMERSNFINGVKKMSLPRKFRVKGVTIDVDPEELKCENEKKESCNIDTITEAYLNYKTSGNKFFLTSLKNVNLYCLQLCHTSLELYTVPFYLAGLPASRKENRDFVILEDVEGDFQHFMEITKPVEFAQNDDPKAKFTCEKCNVSYGEKAKLNLHEALNCGDNFEIFETDSNYEEEYPIHFEMKTHNETWLLFGLRNIEKELQLMPAIDEEQLQQERFQFKKIQQIQQQNIFD
ncbi:protein terminus-like [Teleopsis dalmanni]|uniref:protein terminus-like n=1 Tax=Teleopsis dalmanni TaxID=139649 RepID=UPI0018CEE45A|nr:protein terminus-like [Teleopsis dalmanni]